MFSEVEDPREKAFLSGAQGPVTAEAPRIVTMPCVKVLLTVVEPSALKLVIFSSVAEAELRENADANRQARIGRPTSRGILPALSTNLGLLSICPSTLLGQFWLACLHLRS